MSTLRTQVLDDLGDLRKHVRSSEGCAALCNAEDLLRAQVEVWALVCDANWVRPSTTCVRRLHAAPSRKAVWALIHHCGTQCIPRSTFVHKPSRTAVRKPGMMAAEWQAIHANVWLQALQMRDVDHELAAVHSDDCKGRLRMAKKASPWGMPQRARHAQMQSDEHIKAHFVDNPTTIAARLFLEVRNVPLPAGAHTHLHARARHASSMRRPVMAGR